MPNNNDFPSDMARMMRPFPSFLNTTPSETFLFPRQEVVTSNMADDESTLTLEKLTSAMSEMKVAPQLPRIIESDAMVDIVEDWSKCRSPSRAKRREKRGPRFRQRVIRVYVPKKESLMIGGNLYMHPVTAMEMRRKLTAHAERVTDNALYSGYLGMLF